MPPPNITPTIIYVPSILIGELSQVKYYSGVSMTIYEGPLSYENWMEHLAEKKSKQGYEIKLYSDAHITGELLDGIGPYQFFNSMHMPDHFLPSTYDRIYSELITPVIILRVDDYIDRSKVWNFDLEHTEDSHYHGGTQNEEIAALMSLIFGIRLKSGEISRDFKIGDDPRGKPTHYPNSRKPIFLQAKNKLVIPQARCSVLLTDSKDKLFSYVDLSPRDALALVKAARLYQDALWIVESEPELSWILFVSAVETAANHWREEQGSPIERLEISKPELFELLMSKEDISFVENVADMIVPMLGATNKFVKFIIEFLPDPPPNRPIPVVQYPWTRRKLKESLSKIYGYRSDALHGSRPFPAPMCWPPSNSANGNPVEIPPGIASGTGQSTWMMEDIPMLLHLFAYLVRGVLLNWWSSIL